MKWYTRLKYPVAVTQNPARTATGSTCLRLAASAKQRQEGPETIVPRSRPGSVYHESSRVTAVGIAPLSFPTPDSSLVSTGIAQGNRL